MNVSHDLERKIADLYASEAPSRAPDWVLKSTLAAVESTPQRRVIIRAPRRIRSMNKLALLAAAVLIAAVGAVGLAVFRFGTTSVGQTPGPGVVAPSAGSSSGPSASPSATTSGYHTPLGMALVNLDGTVREELGLPTDAWTPDLSADGAKVVFRTSSTDIGACGRICSASLRLAVVEVGHSTGNFILTGRANTSDNQPAWSPDGTRLAFTAPSPDGGNTDVYVVDVFGGSPATHWLAIDPATDEWPAWSPDGSTIYYTNAGSQPTDDSGLSSTQEIWRVPASGGTPERLTQNDVSDIQPDVAADGRVAFWHDGEIWTMDPDGNNQRALPGSSPGSGFNPRWSPDGSLLALLRYDPSERANLDPALAQPSDPPLLEVVVVDLATGAVKDVGPRVATYDNPVSWTPDGQALLVNRYDDGS